MGSFLLKKAVGLSNISDLLDKSGIFYNYSTKVLPSFDYDTAGKHIAREDSTWNGKYVIGQPAEVTYSFPKWEGKFNQFGNKNPYEFNELQKEHARKSLDAWSDIANIKFTEVAVGNVDGMKASDVKQILLLVISMIPMAHFRLMQHCLIPMLMEKIFLAKHGLVIIIMQVILHQNWVIMVV